MTDQQQRHDHLETVQNLSRSPWPGYEIHDTPTRAERIGEAILRGVLWILVALIAFGVFVTLTKADRVVPHEINQAEGMK